MTDHSLCRRLLTAFAHVAALLATTTTAHAAISAFPGLAGVRIWEFSGGPNAHNYLPLAPALLNQLPVLNTVINDFTGVPSEPYDVFYSNANGSPNPLGNYLSVEAKYPFPNVGGGLNLGAVDLIVGSGPFTFVRADVLASFVGLGPNYIPGSELNAVDPFDTTAIPATATTMGSNPTPAQRMRVTVTWSKIIPEPTSAGLSASAVALLALKARRRRAGVLPA